MIREDTLWLPAELDELEIRCVAAGGLPPDAKDIATLRHDIQARRADLIERLARWHQLDVAEAYAQAALMMRVTYTEYKELQRET